LPYLRRYARALSGSQASGDAYVAATLEALIQDPKVLDTTASTRIALYRLFTKIWNSVALNGKSGGTESNQPVERHLAWADWRKLSSRGRLRRIDGYPRWRPIALHFRPSHSSRRHCRGERLAWHRVECSRFHREFVLR